MPSPTSTAPPRIPTKAPPSSRCCACRIDALQSLSMTPAPFVHHAPRTLDEAVKVLAQVAPDDGRVLAGGQSLVPTMAFRLAKPAHLVDINNVAGLDRLAAENGALSIGAC